MRRLVMNTNKSTNASDSVIAFESVSYLYVKVSRGPSPIVGIVYTNGNSLLDTFPSNTMPRFNGHRGKTRI